MKKYNKYTKCYKIDVIVDGAYLWSTDQSKTCKEAVEKAKVYLRKNGRSFEKVTANFYRS